MEAFLLYKKYEYEFKLININKYLLIFIIIIIFVKQTFIRYGKKTNQY